MSASLNKLTVKGFKSLEALIDFRLNKLNVLIGANGSGKSNFVDFFRMLRALADESFQQFINDQGGGDNLLFLGPKNTQAISAALDFGQNEYCFELTPTRNGSLQISNETAKYKPSQSSRILSNGTLESSLKALREEKSSLWPNSYGVPHYIYEAVSNWTVYHFHDTSPLAAMRRDHSTRDWERLRHDAANIASFLNHLKVNSNSSYLLIRDTVRLIAPFFDDFLFRSQTKGNDEVIRLEWMQKGSDFPFQPGQLSDGTIRFICIAATLLQPKPPATIIIDEPELGLHPYAISILADLLHSASMRTQVVISTQSPLLLDYFDAADVIVVNRVNGHSDFARLSPEEFKFWLEDYSVGELWQKNVVKGGPARE